MRAIPSPTLSTWPTSETSASWPKFLIWILEDRGDFSGPDIHQETSFIACLIALSLVRSELSTMREPTLTINPPMIAGSTFTSTCTCLPVTARSASLDGGKLPIVRLLGQCHVGGHLALVMGDQRPKILDDRAHRKQTAVLRHDQEELRRHPADPREVEDGRERLRTAGRRRMPGCGQATSRSGLFGLAAHRTGRDRPSRGRWPAPPARQLEQGGGAGDPPCRKQSRSFAVHDRALSLGQFPGLGPFPHESPSP